MITSFSVKWNLSLSSNHTPPSSFIGYHKKNRKNRIYSRTPLFRGWHVTTTDRQKMNEREENQPHKLCGKVMLQSVALLCFSVKEPKNCQTIVAKIFHSSSYSPTWYVCVFIFSIVLCLEMEKLLQSYFCVSKKFLPIFHYHSLSCVFTLVLYFILLFPQLHLIPLLTLSYIGGESRYGLCPNTITTINP